MAQYEKIDSKSYLEDRADASYLQSIEDLLGAIDMHSPVHVETLTHQLEAAHCKQDNISSFVVVPGYGSRKRVAETIANLPEQLAAPNVLHLTF